MKQTIHFDIFKNGEEDTGVVELFYWLSPFSIPISFFPRIEEGNEVKEISHLIVHAGNVLTKRIELVLESKKILHKKEAFILPGIGAYGAPVASVEDL